tara:strand:- start:410 stop:829 length:420 start_codon:yes stop_codon:yes gene_type:complete
MKALIILAHGSRKQEYVREIENLTNDVGALIKRHFDSDLHLQFSIVDYAFLEIAEPSLTNLIEKLVSKNISKITIFPYFLNSGVHIKNDIPNIVEYARSKHPGCEFIMLPPFGAYNEMPKIILKQLKDDYESGIYISSK